MPNDIDDAKEPIAQSVGQAVPHSIREIVNAVAGLEADAVEGGVTVAVLAKKLGLEKSSVSSLTKDAIKRGYLKNLEGKRGRPARLVLGNPLSNEADHGNVVAGKPIEDKSATLEIKPNPLATSLQRTRKLIPFIVNSGRIIK